MQLVAFARILSMWLLLFAAALVLPLAVSLIYHDNELRHYLLVLVICLFISSLLLFTSKKQKVQLRKKESVIIVILLWLITSVLGGITFIVGIGLSPADAFFESVSAFTTTGATVIHGLDKLPPSILFFRQEMQWLGGIGIVVSAIALFPMLGIGGMQMLKAEMTGPIKDEKITPRINHTAKVMWKLYLGMTIVCALFYWLGGMSVFDAIAHSLSTISTGGFSTHDDSLGYFHSSFIELVSIIFMMAGGVNFGIHFHVAKQLTLRPYWDNTEVKMFLLVTGAIILLVSLDLYYEGEKNTLFDAVRYAGFTVVSVITSTGFEIEDFSLWPVTLPLLLIFISFIGGCAGSTAGGMKVIRFILLLKSANLETQKLIHPNLVKSIKLQNKPVSMHVIDAVSGFFVMYVVTFIIFILVLMCDGIDQITAFGAVATCMNNMGPGLGEVATNFSAVSDFSKWALSLTMLLGRLEIFTVLVMLSPSFWEK